MYIKTDTLTWSLLAVVAAAFLLSGCAKSGYCLRPGPMPEFYVDDETVADRERIVVVRQMLSTMSRLESPQAKANIIRTLPSWFPRGTEACDTEYLSWLESRYLSPRRGQPYQATALSLAAVDALVELQSMRKLRPDKARILIHMYTTPLQKHPYKVLPYENGSRYPTALPNKSDILVHIATAMSKTNIIYDSAEYQDFLLDVIAKEKDPTVGLVLHDHLMMAMVQSRAPVTSQSTQRKGQKVALEKANELLTTLEQPFHHIDTLKLYLRTIDSLSKHAKTLRIESQVKSTFAQVEARLDKANLVKSGASSRQIRLALQHAKVQMNQR